MKYFILFLIFCACDNDTQLSRFCPTTCYTGRKGSDGLGVCHSGVPICDADFNIIECVGEVVPSQELCNGLDDSCVGIHPDMFLEWPVRADSLDKDLNPCESMRGECKNSKAACQNGAWKCLYPETVELDTDGKLVDKETWCDQKDGNCDGLIDNIDYIGQYCYDGEIGTEINPPCHPGEFHCINGEVVCKNEKVPTVEICGNQIDDDCNLLIDDIVGQTQYDIFFIIDISGSMYDKIYAISEALLQYVIQFQDNLNFKFGLVVIGIPDEPFMRLELPLGDITILQETISILDTFIGGSLEPSYDSMLWICDKGNNNFNINWRPGANALFFQFTDEGAQTYTNPRTYPQDIIDACLGNGVLPFVWSFDPFDFGPVVDASNGQHFTLIADWQVILNDMDSIIFKLCGSQ